jgi:hypothetical protein
MIAFFSNLARAYRRRKAQQEIDRCIEQRKIILNCLDDYRRLLNRTNADEALARHKLWSL